MSSGVANDTSTEILVEQQGKCVVIESFVSVE